VFHYIKLVWINIIITWRALTEKYLNIACSFVTPNDKRIDLLDKLCSEYKVDGVIDVIIQTCHTYNIEKLRLKRFFDGKGHWFCILHYAIVCYII
jgi:benzoyl-CoA reductase/2-hydroxyglutaryl-CoA dehydratase subunit BcrC/BadD/HgdB